MSGSYFVGSRQPLYENADGDLVKKLFVTGGDTLYVGTSDQVSSSNYGSALSAGQSVSLSQGRWLLSSGQSLVFTEQTPLSVASGVPKKNSDGVTPLTGFRYEVIAQVDGSGNPILDTDGRPVIDDIRIVAA